MSLAGFETLTVASVRKETEDAISVAFTVPEGFRFQPGQYLTLRTDIGGSELRRCYSICSAPDDPTPRIAIKRVAGGVFSAWAHEALAEGRTIEAMRPMGRFVLPPAAGGRVVLGVAAGSGITPVLGIMEAVLAQEKDSRFVLIYGSRSTGNILFRSRLEALKDRHMGRLSVVHVLSREQQDVPVLNGRIDAAKIAALLPGLLGGALPDIAVLCGPEAVMDGAAAALHQAGMPSGQILSERFVVEGAPARRPALLPPTADGPAFAHAGIIADGVRTEIPLAEGETVLEGALRAGLDLPYSCRGGMCSTCRARLVEGQVTMDLNYGLEPWETAAGYILTCQSHPTTPHVVVDYDHV